MQAWEETSLKINKKPENRLKLIGFSSIDYVRA